MGRYVFAVASVGAALALAGCASDSTVSTDSTVEQAATSTAAPRQCFNADMVSGFSPGDDRNTIYVTAGTRDTYELKTDGFCDGLDWTHQIGIETRFGSRVCEGYDAVILARSLGREGMNRCNVTSVRKLTPEEAQAQRNG